MVFMNFYKTILILVTEKLKIKNQIIFDYKNKEDFYKSIISYISGMTDNFAIEIYNEIIRF